MIDPWFMWDYDPPTPYGPIAISVTDADGESIKLPDCPKEYGQIPDKLCRYEMESTWP